MKLNILSSVQYNNIVLQPGVTVAIPERQAIALIRANAAEPVGRAALDVWAVRVAADLAAKQIEESAQAAFGLPREPEYIGGHSRRVLSQGGAHV